jgi:hypothetical protein
LASILWLWLELRSRRLRGIENARGYGLSFHHLNAIGWPLLLALLVLMSFRPRCLPGRRCIGWRSFRSLR